MKLIRVAVKKMDMNEDDKKVNNLLKKLINTYERFKTKAIKIYPAGKKDIESEINKLNARYRKLLGKSAAEIKDGCLKINESSDYESWFDVMLYEDEKLEEYFTYGKETELVGDLYEQIMRSV